ncbi:MAG: hypothetical protein FD161_3113 [Limisphaerales bacterium]|nr:MAG: hypothetical protein FD161_3113 [Limisphaerales bacterium]KAG0508022.1 MAG: hypothetical protein E1N63_2820 [Limisphaerales bacterium]TXT50443.1 MAG: hypothetical protein FD140_2366 [Limisphaerales bacterium]
MIRQLTTDDARQSLRDHCAAKGGEVRAKFGPHLGWAELNQLLEDRKFVRYPCSIAFDALPLQAGEFAYPEPLAESPEAGYRICVHPRFERDLDSVPALVLYQLVAVNYGDFATPEDAEAFGAAALGLSREEYYHRLCACADQVGEGGAERGVHAADGQPGNCCSSNCGCSSAPAA